MIHLVVFFVLCDLVALLIRRLMKKELSVDVRAAAAVALCALYLGVGWYQAHHVAVTGYPLPATNSAGGRACASC